MLMQNIILTPHFTLQEFTESATARKYGIDNSAPAEVVKNLRRLCENTLEPLREVLDMPVIITSGYRCKALNLRISCSSRKSQHMLGQAADFFVSSRTVQSHRELLVKAFRMMLISDRIDFDQLILYPTFIHVSYVSPKANRHRILVGKGGGLYGSVTRERALTLL
ncbi:MAG: peptidase M15 [Bacteroidaceae bacterium]|nr:peptidase M15 [Bacteroidaceae bacterium]